VSPARTSRDFEGTRITTADWPILLIEFGAKIPSDAGFQAGLAYIESLMADAARTRDRYFSVQDLTQVRELMPASQRKYASEWMKRTAALARATGVGSASVTPSAFLRGVLTALYLLQPPPTPTVFVATRREAMQKGLEALEREGVRISPRLIAAATRAAHDGRAGG
jgi:hypothetical protein